MMTVSVKLSEMEVAELDKRRAEANMNRSDYIRNSVKNSPIHVIDKSQLFYQSLNRIEAEIQNVESRIPQADCSTIREEVMNACLLLNL